MNKYCDPYNFLHSPGLFPVTSSSSSSHSSSSRPQKNQVRCHPDELAEIIMLIERGEDHMELKLSQMQPNLSLGSVCKILYTLNEHGVSALRFFAWVRKTQPDFIPNSKICNLMIDNFGRLDNYEGMLVLLTELSKKGHCLTEKAFGFLAGVRTKDSVKRVVETLNIVKGSCCSSGIYALIKVLCSLNSFDQAMFVMQETARKTSYYHVLIAAKCRNGSFHQAHDLFDEMRSSRCDPNTKSYNYLLGSLCKRGRIAEACQLLQVMENLGYLPDSVTYEIFASHACRLGNMDFAIQFLHHMMEEGVQPRLTTHAVFIKGYFRSGQVTDAYRYVLEMSSKDKYSRNMNYSLLGRLFHESGRVVEARDILVEMVDKGFKPNFPVYIKVLKDLFKSGMGNLAADLKFRFSKLNSSTDG